MSRGSGFPLIPVAVFLALVLIVLPAGAQNVTGSPTTGTANQTLVTPVQTTIAVNQTTVTVNQTAVPVNQTALPTTLTTAATPLPTVSPRNTTVPATLPSAIVTTAAPATPGVTTPSTGSVYVISSPGGTSVTIDGIFSGITPVTVNGVPAGDHLLRLELGGYHPYEGSIYVLPGQTARAFGALQPLEQATTAPPVQTVIVPVIVPVATAAPVPAEDSGLLGDSGIIAAILGAFAVVILSAAKIFTHVRPPKKE